MDKDEESERAWRVAREAGARAREVEGRSKGLVEARKRTVASATTTLEQIDAHFRHVVKHQRELREWLRAVAKAACQPVSDAVFTRHALLRLLDGARGGSACSFQSGVGANATAQHTRLVLVVGGGTTRRRAGAGGARRCSLDFVVEGGTSRGALGAWRRACRVHAEDAERWEARAGVAPRPFPCLNEPRCYFGACSTQANHVVVAGGSGFGGVLNSVECATHGHCDWRADLVVPTPRYHCGACAVGNSVVVAGGLDPAFQFSDAVEAVDVVSGARTALPPLPTRLCGCGVVALRGKVIVTGGWDSSLPVDSVLALDVGHDVRSPEQPPRWAPLPSMARARFYHGAAAGGGRVFVCGGYSGSGPPLDSCEMLQVGEADQARWEALPPIPTPLCYVGCCFGGGNVFVAAGYPMLQRSVFALAVERRMWTHVAELDSARWGCAVVCVGRRVLVLGGYNEGEGGHLGSCEALEF